MGWPPVMWGLKLCVATSKTATTIHRGCHLTVMHSMLKNNKCGSLCSTLNMKGSLPPVDWVSGRHGESSWRIRLERFFFYQKKAQHLCSILARALVSQKNKGESNFAGTEFSLVSRSVHFWHSTSFSLNVAWTCSFSLTMPCFVLCSHNLWSFTVIGNAFHLEIQLYILTHGTNPLEQVEEGSGNEGDVIHPITININMI